MYISPTKKPYRIHKGVLSFYSGYFRKALQDGRSKANKTNEMVFENTHIDAFDAITNWLYSHRLHPEVDTDSTKISETTIIKAWVLGHAWDIPALMNAAVNLVHHKISEAWEFPTHEVEHVYEFTVPGHKLRTYIIDVIAKISEPKDVLGADDTKFWCKDALLDLSKRVWGKRIGMVSKEEFAEWGLCQYHEHEEGARCTKKEL